MTTEIEHQIPEEKVWESVSSGNVLRGSGPILALHTALGRPCFIFTHQNKMMFSTQLKELKICKLASFEC